MKLTTYHIFFTNLANPLKMDIILSLREKEKNVGEIVKDLNFEQSKISHALASLKRCNIVKSKHDGKQRIYSLNKDTILPMLNMIDKHAMTHCGKKCACKDCQKSE
jgi:ArsR family transcriptional regulator, zinc-responsive transcriptional repressor